jgi:hypothetical protein
VIREAKKLHYKRLIENSSNKMKTSWNIIKTELNKRNNPNDMPSSLKLNNNNFQSGVAAEVFNDYYQNLAEN